MSITKIAKILSKKISSEIADRINTYAAKRAVMRDFKTSVKDITPRTVVTTPPAKVISAQSETSIDTRDTFGHY